MSVQASLTAAIVTAGVAVLVAVVTQVSAWLLERSRQTYERRRAGLIEMQDVALEVRHLLVESGRGLAGAVAQVDPATGTVGVVEDDDLVRRRAQKERELAMRISRLDDAAPRVAVETWVTSARFALLGAGDDAVTPAQEQQDWDTMCEAVRSALARGARGSRMSRT